MKKILIIEDDPAIQRGLSEYLTAQYFEVICSADGLAGFNTAIQIKPDVILLDVNLPSMNGVDVCRKLRQNSFNNPILMITSLQDSIDKVIGLEVGADDYITKPFNLRELLARIRTNIRRFEENRERRDKIISSSDKLQRHLQALMFTDMKDYSKKMNKNEESALKVLNYHNLVMTETINNYSGRIVEIIGDAFLASFESAVNAVLCSVELQNKFRLYNQSRKKFDRIKIRIGLHLGDVIEYEGKLKGDALNVAARIQQLTAPEDICVSESIYLAAKDKVKNKFQSEGEWELKNINTPVRIYKVIY
jgi:DNA-binding response OmpR family regulator